MGDLTAFERAREEGREHLHSLPNVKSVGIGFKEAGGEITDELCLRVYVTRKRAPSELSADERVPGQIGGVSTDVIVKTPDVFIADETKRRPVPCGLQIERVGLGFKTFQGSITCFVKKTTIPSAPDVFLLTAAHVLDPKLSGASFDPIDDWVHQPTASGWTNAIAERTEVILRNGGKVDAGIAALHGWGGNDVAYSNYVWKLGKIKGTTSLSDRAFPAPRVAKFGRSTGKTFGYVIDFSYPMEVGNTNLTDQLLIAFDPKATKDSGSHASRFAEKGDSGAPVMEADVFPDGHKDGRRLVGLLVGANLKDKDGIVSKIDTVFSELKVSLA